MREGPIRTTRHYIPFLRLSTFCDLFFFVCVLLRFGMLCDKASLSLYSYSEHNSVVPFKTN